MALTIRTNNQWREFVYRYDVPADVLASQFDYQDPEETLDGFFQYRGTWYHLDQFMRIEPMSPGDPHALRPGDDSPLKGWHGYHGDSYFSGVLIRLSDDGERYQIATYFS